MKQIDRIRSMNAEEMAEWLLLILRGKRNETCLMMCANNLKKQCFTEGCRNGIKAWLESEVEE